MIVVTGGAGFIGSNFVLEWLATEGSPVVNLDKLTYAGNLENLASLKADKRHIFVTGDINDRALVGRLLREHRPRAIVHFAAESHVDRSIQGPDAFMHTNVMGTFALLEEARAYWSALKPPEKDAFRFLHVSTDEVYGSLGLTDPEFTESTPYAPNSPYAASKAAADHLVRACHHTYGLPTLTTNCSNNYGPFQNPEKFIPLMILNGLREKPMPIYGDGSNIRDWLHVGDHCAAVRRVLARGRAGETYNIGSRSELENVDVVKAICALLDEAHPKRAPHDKLVQFVKDRPGHDRRYAMDPRKLEKELGWKPAHSFTAGLRKTFEWFLDNTQWADRVMSGEYKRWIDANYAKRGPA
ncbi:MAG TPA: dTDP-glucose 4,6-dehydratase [Burkholderiales bacterium]|nr:dTDP-glucose 4,6-dehydratase [Burkholderiales bacterium]